MAQRIKGQEVEVLLIVNGVVKSTLTAVKSFSFNFEQEIKDEGYLGETTNRKDSIFNGISGDIEYHFDSPDIFSVISELINKAQRRTPGVQVNIKAALNFPSGRRVRVIIPDCEFGQIPVNFGSRTDYGTVRMSYAASTSRTIV